MSVGYDHIDLKACKNSNISVGYTPDVLTDTTADIAVALLLATSRRIPEGIQAVKEGKWPAWKPEWLLGKDVSNATVGIFGFGRIGQSFAKKMNKAFNCKILYSGLNGRKEKEEKEKNATYVDLNTLLAESDFVSAHCALNEKTKHFFNKQIFKKMKKDSIFINTTRGEFFGF
jgi:lactate dehydrogenase-like 2-hydroxyacid dehydrogenase